MRMLLLLRLGPPQSTVHFSLFSATNINEYKQHPCLPSDQIAVVVLVLVLGMVGSVDPLVVGRVIGDVVDLFVPSVSMSVRFGSKHVSNGCAVKPSIAADPPSVHISGGHAELYTLVMTDPDAPSPSEPTMREWLHWMVINMPGGIPTCQGEEVVEYAGPRPLLGIHRYVLVLFQQQYRLPLPPPLRTRANFSTRSFAAHHDLGFPVASVFFNSQKEPANRRR